MLVASQQLRERSLFPPTFDPMTELPVARYCLLEVVGSSRRCGIPRPYLTSKILKIDARSTFHHVKKLQKLGLLQVKVSVSVCV